MILAPARVAASRSTVTRSARISVTLCSGSPGRRPRATSPSSLPLPAHIRCRATANPDACTCGRQPRDSRARSRVTAGLRNEPRGPAGSSCASYTVTSTPARASAIALAAPATPPPATTILISASALSELTFTEFEFGEFSFSMLEAAAAVNRERTSRGCTQGKGRGHRGRAEGRGPQPVPGARLPEHEDHRHHRGGRARHRLVLRPLRQQGGPAPGAAGGHARAGERGPRAAGPPCGPRPHRPRAAARAPGGGLAGDARQPPGRGRPARVGDRRGPRLRPGLGAARRGHRNAARAPGLPARPRPRAAGRSHAGGRGQGRDARPAGGPARGWNPGWQDLTVAFDELDRRIVAALVDDARATYAEVGAQVGLSAPAVKRRVDRLRASGAITGFSARVDPSALGWTTEAYVELFCRGRTSPEQIAAAVGKHPEVVAACTVTGEADALLHIRSADMRHFEQVVERIGAEPLVVRTRSVIVLSQLVHRPDTVL